MESPHASPAPPRGGARGSSGNLAQKGISVGMGTIAVSRMRLTSLEVVGAQTELKRLFAQHNLFKDFSGLQEQPNLQELQLQHNHIQDFFGVVAQPHLEDISLEGNPVTHHPHYRLACLLAFGPTLRRIDGKAVTRSELAAAKEYGAPIARAVRKGWMPNDADVKDQATMIGSVREFLHVREEDVDDDEFGLKSLEPDKEVPPAVKPAEEEESDDDDKTPDQIAAKSKKRKEDVENLKRQLAQRDGLLRRARRQLEATAARCVEAETEAHDALVAAETQQGAVARLKDQIKKERSLRINAERKASQLEDEVTKLRNARAQARNSDAASPAVKRTMGQSTPRKTDVRKSTSSPSGARKTPAKSKIPKAKAKTTTKPAEKKGKETPEPAATTPTEKDKGETPDELAGSMKGMAVTESAGGQEQPNGAEAVPPTPDSAGTQTPTEGDSSAALSQYPIRVVSWDYTPEEEDEVALTKGEQVYILEELTGEFEGWLRVQTSGGQTGIAPANFFT